jgi:ketosteroid isomerase-like protein
MDHKSKTMDSITGEAKAELMQFGRDWDKAIAANDVDGMSRYMDDSWVIVGSGGITSKEDFLASVRSGDLQHTTMDFKDIRVEAYGSMGIVTSKGISAGNYKGNEFSSYEWTTSVYIRKMEKWTCVLTMLAIAGEN